jgi:hypothetical protein
MGLHLCYELSAPALDAESDVLDRLAMLRDRASKCRSLVFRS